MESIRRSAPVHRRHIEHDVDIAQRGQHRTVVANISDAEFQQARDILRADMVGTTARRRVECADIVLFAFVAREHDEFVKASRHRRRRDG